MAVAGPPRGPRTSISAAAAATALVLENAHPPVVLITAGACANASSGSGLQPGRAVRRELAGVAIVWVVRVDRVRENGSCRCEGNRKECILDMVCDPSMEGLS